MADITSQERFIALQWKRGKGYYEAHTHQRPFKWELFNQALKELEPHLSKIQRSCRYRAYLLSWRLHWPQEPLEAADVSSFADRGEMIMGRLEQMVEREVQLRSEHGQGKQTKTRKSKGRVR